MLKGHFIHFGIAANRDLNPFGEGVDHRDPHPMQTTGKLIVFVGELTTGMQFGKDQLDPGDPLLRVNIHRHTTAIVCDFQRVVCV